MLYTLGGNPPQVQQVASSLSNLDGFEFSPDGQWLVGFEQNPKAFPMDSFTYYLISQSGQVFPAVVDLSEVTDLVHRSGAEASYLQYWHFQWINSRILKVTMGFGETRTIVYAYKYYDIQTGTWWEEPLQNLPNFKKDLGWSQVSPDLTRILYLDRDGRVVLYDLEQQKELLKRLAGGFNPFISDAQWSRDGQYIAFRTPAEQLDIQILSHDGDKYAKVKEITFTPRQGDLSLETYNFIWSPDSQFLAISGVILDKQKQLQTPSLYLYDTAKEEFTFRCAMGEPAEYVNARFLQYSPDGDQIVTTYRKYIEIPFRLYDLTSGSVYQFREGNAGAVGWVGDFSRNWK